MTRLGEAIVDYVSREKNRGESIEQIETDLHVMVYEALKLNFPEENLP
jgi:hypothetical protein